MTVDGQLIVYNKKYEIIGIAVELVISPYYAEEVAGIKRLKVWSELADHKSYYGWDWWSLADTTYVTSDGAVVS